MSQQESHTAILVAAEAVLRACDYPSCRGLPAVTVPTTLLGQLAGAVASVVDGAPDAPHGHQDALCTAPRVETDSDTLTTLRATCDELRAQLAELRGDRPGFCSADPTCWMLPMVPGGTCYGHSEIAQKPHPFESMRMRDRMFRDTAEQDG